MIGTCCGNWCFAWSRSVRKFLFCCRCGVSLTNSELDRVWVRLNVSNDGMYSYKSLIKAFAHKQTGQDVRREQTDSESRPALGPSTNGCYYMVDLFLPLWLANIQQCRKDKMLYSPACDLGGQYNIWFFIHWTKNRSSSEIWHFSICLAMASN